VFVDALPRLWRDWFDDKIVLRPWTHTRPPYIRTSERLDADADSAESRDWPIIRLEGTHLHPMLAPEEAANALLSPVPRLG
jgi:hypothetical protein